MKHKLFKFLTLFFLVLLGTINLSAKDITVYAVGSEVFGGWNNSTSSMKIDVNTNSGWSYDQNMTKTDFTYKGSSVYSYTFTTSGGGNVKFKHYQNGNWKEDYGAGDWNDNADYMNGKLYIGYKENGHRWITVCKDATYYFIKNGKTTSWIALKAHAWNDSYTTITTTWPGTDMTKTSRKYEGKDIYSITFNDPPYSKVIFNQGSNVDQSAEVSLAGNEGRLFDYENNTWKDYNYDVTVTYHANGHGTAPSAQTIFNGNKATKPSDPSADGLTFVGWYQNDQCTGDAWNFNTPINEDMDLYAKWVVSLTVAKGTGISSVDGAAPETSVGSQHTISATPAEGYHFGQWTASPAANAEIADATSASTNVTVKNGSVTVTATGALNSYNITYPDVTAQANGHFTISNQTNSGNYTTTANFTATPAKGYRLAVTATYGSSVNVPLTHDDFSYNYSFKIPAGDVTINVTAYRYGLAYSLSSGGFDESGVVRFDGNDQIVLSNLAAHSVYKFKLYNEAYTSDNNSHFMGNAGAWQIYKNENNMVPSIGVECFYINTGSDGNYVISLGDNNNNKPSINITYPDVCKINIDNKDYTLTQVGETNIYETELIQLNRNVDYWFYLYWHGPRLGDKNGNTMSNTNHNGWKYESQYYNKQSILSTHNTPKTAHYKFQFDASESKLTVIYPSAISGDFPDQDWNDQYTLDFTDNVGTRKITLVASQSAIPFKVVDDGVFYGAQSKSIIASQQDIQLTASNASDYDMNLTPIVDGNYTFTYDRSTHKLSVEYPASTETYDVTVYEDGITSKIVNVGLTPATITAQVPESMVFDKWEKEGAVTINDATSATTTITATGAGASVRAVFKTQNTIYFKDNAGWGDVWLHFYTGSYWNETYGSGSLNILHSGMHANKIGKTDVWYFNKSGSEYNDWTSGIMAFTNIAATGHDNFFMVNCSYFDGIRGLSTFDDRTPLFVPRKYITDRLKSSQYYLEGIWMKYNSTESGFDLRGKNTTDNNDNSITWDDRNHKFTAPTPGEYTFSTTLHLLGDQTYEMKIYDAANREYSHTGDMMTSTSCTNYKLPLKTTKNFTVKTTAEGDYVFTISVGGGEMLLSITYPLSDGDYRVVYVENTIEQTNGYLVKKISEGTQKDTASFFIATGATGQVKLQQCTNASTQTWEDVSPAQTVSVSGKTNGVYNFIVSQNGSSATLSDGGKYTGDFYIRTQGVDGGLEGFKKNADNKLTAYASLLDAGITYGNFEYNYFKTKWVSSGKDVSFCVANDYSKNISSEFGSDAIIDPVQTPTKETLPQSANVRFMWNSKTNQLKRAYISGSTDIAARFLVLMGDDKMFNANGDTLTEGKGKIAGLNDYELNFADKNNWVYQADIKAQPGCAVKLTAKYNNNVQYFIGAEGDGAGSRDTIIKGSSTDVTKYTMRVVYDFKTNLLIAGWMPSDTIKSDIALGGDMLITRTHQDSAQQIIFGGNVSISDIHHVYGVLSIKKDTMLGKETSPKYKKPATNADYERTMYWVSFPFKVKISEIFGVDGYGTKWIMQKYRGDLRAQKGWFKQDTPTFWEYMDVTDSLNAYEGYLFLIDANYFNTEDADVWKNSATEANFYFPSASGNIGIINKSSFTQEVPENKCGIDRTFNVQGVGEVNHMNTDSYWNVIGVPAFQNKSMVLGSETKTDMKAIYKWNSENNTYTPQALADEFRFQTMHAYMVQFGGDITWTDVSVVNNPTPAQGGSAPRYAYADTKNYFIKLFFGNNEAEDHAYINLSDEAATDFVLNEDMMKLDNAGYPNIYSFAGNYNVAYNETKMTNQSVMIGVSAPKNGSYTFSMPKDFSGSAILVDLEEGTYTDLNVSNYSVDLNKGTYNNRFQLMLEVEAKIPTNIQNTNGGLWSEDGKTQKLLINDQIYLINAGRIYNATGTMVR